MSNYKRVEERPFKQQLLDSGVVIILKHQRLDEFDHVKFNLIVSHLGDALHAIQANHLIRMMSVEKCYTFLRRRRLPLLQEVVSLSYMLRIRPVHRAEEDVQRLGNRLEVVTTDQ